MLRDDDLLPLKRVLELTGVSRSTLWRVSGSGIEGFPEPTMRGRRLFWRQDDIPAIAKTIKAFEGRSVFERKKKRGRVETQRAALALLKHAKLRAKRPRSAAKKPTQGDLFS